MFSGIITTVIEKVKITGLTKDEIYINLICTLFNEYINNIKDDIESWEFFVPNFIKEDKFKINIDLIRNKDTQKLIKSSEKVEYIFKVSCGSSGTFSSTNFFYLTGGNTPTASSPLTWYVAYATVYDTTKWGQSNTAIFKATDSDSGIVGYGINQSSTGAPAYTTCTSKSSIATQIENITVNGTYYLWVIDAVGNQSKQAFTVA
ncbi:hypothetical protein EOM86_04835, partial [Candidatus Nomurabacteria bacterium]|nr:hypothetical protein [Candidatus Nomurabacteria bacterium]